MKKGKILFVFIVIAAIPLLIYVGANLYMYISEKFESPPMHRPMVCYNERLLFDVKPVEIEIDGSFEHIGTINSSVPPTQIPLNHLETNCDTYINAELYENAVGEIYLQLPNGIVLFQEYSK